MTKKRPRGRKGQGRRTLAAVSWHGGGGGAYSCPGAEAQPPAGVAGWVARSSPGSAIGARADSGQDLGPVPAREPAGEPPPELVTEQPLPRGLRASGRLELLPTLLLEPERLLQRESAPGLAQARA